MDSMGKVINRIDYAADAILETADGLAMIPSQERARTQLKNAANDVKRDVKELRKIIYPSTPIAPLISTAKDVKEMKEILFPEEERK